MRYTKYEDRDLRGVSRPAQLSPEIAIAGIRATRAFRVFGAYHKHVFYLLWFNRDHDIVKG